MSTATTALSVLIAALAGQLASDDFRVRERASTALRDMMPAALPILLKSEKSRDAEMAVRARRIVDAWYQSNADRWAAETKPTGYPVIPWLCGTPKYGIEQEDIEAYLSAARGQIGMQGSPDWQDYRLATRLLIADLYARRQQRSRIIEMLDYLVRAERKWIADHGGVYSPPLKAADDLPR